MFLPPSAVGTLTPLLSSTLAPAPPQHTTIGTGTQLCVMSLYCYVLCLGPFASPGDPCHNKHSTYKPYQVDLQSTVRGPRPECCLSVCLLTAGFTGPLNSDRVVLRALVPVTGDPAVGAHAPLSAKAGRKARCNHTKGEVCTCGKN